MPELSSRSLKLAVLGFALMAPIALGACDRQSTEAAQPAAASPATQAPGAELMGVIDRSHKGSALPDFTFSDPAGQQLSLASLKGTPLLINLWATWCGPCVVEMPMLNQLAGERAGKLKVLTVSQDLGQPQKVGAFFTDRKLDNLEPWLDPDNALAQHYQASTLPTTIYYDAAGREVWRFVGGHDWSSAETAKMLAEAD